MLRAVRRVAKFASPEEEAAARRLEVTGISKDTTAVITTTTSVPTTIAAVSDSVTASDSTTTAAASVDGLTELTPKREALLVSKHLAQQIKEEEGSVLSPVRKPTILEQTELTNPGFTAFLNKTRGCGDSSVPVSPIRVFSPKRAALPADGITNSRSVVVSSDESVKPIDKSILLAKTKSKLLKVINYINKNIISTRRSFH